MRKLESALMAAAALILGLGLATGAGATAFTLASSVTLSDPSSDLQVLFLPDNSVSGGSLCLAGVCNLADDFVVFRVQVTHGTPPDPDVDEIRASVITLNSIIGVGVFTDPGDVDPSTGSGAGGTQAIWDFDDPPWVNLTDGDLSDPLFVTYTNSSLLPLADGSTINFSVHQTGGVLYSSPPNTTLVTIPEPSTLGLTAAMLTGLAALRSLRRRQG